MPKQSDYDDSTEKPISIKSDEISSLTSSKDSVVVDYQQKRILDLAQADSSQNSISELQMKALDPCDPQYERIQNNRFEIIDDSEQFSHSEMQLKTLEETTKDPVLKVIQTLADFVRSLAKGSSQREKLNELRQAQQCERLEQLANFYPVFDAPIAMPPPENPELKSFKIKPPDKELPNSILKQSVNPNVSKEFRLRVDHFAKQIPFSIQQALSKNGVGITVYSNSSEVPSDLANRHARGHSYDQSIKNLPMFYEPRSKSLVFIEHPALTSVEQKWQDDAQKTVETNEKKGVLDLNLKNFDAKSVRYDPIERNGWHELGHAVEQTILQGLTKRADFNALFLRELKAINTPDLRDLSYFTNPDNPKIEPKTYVRAKQEVFAQIFLTFLMPNNKLNSQDRKLMKCFSQTGALIKSEAKKARLSV